MLRIKHCYFNDEQNAFIEDFEIIESSSKDSLWDYLESQSVSLPSLSECSLSMN